MDRRFAVRIAAAVTRAAARAAIRLAAAVALCLAALAAPAPASADPLPELVSVKLNDQNHGVVTWTKQPWQRSVSVRWSTGDGALIAADTPYWDFHYGRPLADCATDPTGSPVNGVYPYGQHCHGQDLPDDTVTTMTTKVELMPGTYYFEVLVWGENNYYGNPPCYPSREPYCAMTHWSNVFELHVLPAGDETATPDETGAPQRTPERTPERVACNDPTAECAAEGLPREIDGPATIDLPGGGGELTLDEGARVKLNSAFNIDVEAGRIHVSEDLEAFRCPSWMEPQPDETTLVEWVGVRCRTITTPHGAALVQGTEFSVSVDGEFATFHVYRGQIALSDLSGNGATKVAAGEAARISKGLLPSKPAPFDTASSGLRWWDRTSPAQVLLLVAAGMVAGLFGGLGYLLPAILAVLLRRRRAARIVALDLLAGWTVVGWFASLWLLAKPEPDPRLSRDG